MLQKWLVGLGAAVVLGAGIWYLSHAPATPSVVQETPGSSTTTTTGTSTPVTQTPQPPKTPATASSFTLSLAQGDSVKSWDFTGAYSNDSQLQQKAQTEITRLQGLLGAGATANYDIYVSIANQYDLLGNGKQELSYLEKALTIDSTTTGLAWANAGQLLARLGAYKTARSALEHAVSAQPTPAYHQQLLDFLETYYPSDSTAIQKEEQAVRAGDSN